MEEGAIISSWHSNKPINEKDVHIRQGGLVKKSAVVFLFCEGPLSVTSLFFFDRRPANNWSFPTHQMK